MNTSLNRSRCVVAAVVALCLTRPSSADAGSGQPAVPAATQCDAGSEPVRTGRPLHGDALMPVLIAAIQPAKASAADSTAWCLETSVQAGVREAQVWHKPSQADTTRVTAGTGGFEIRAFREMLPPTLAKDAPSDTIYEVVMMENDKLRIVGFFDGPPPLDALLTFFANERFVIDAEIDLKTHHVTLYRPY